jgi:predicted AlkP superfamily pyrophosphatase or phosphodiesterase
MKPAFVTKTYPNHHSIATGYYPETHGIINNVMFDPLTKETFDGDNKAPDVWWNSSPAIPVWVCIHFKLIIKITDS